jgi:MFS family permease
MRGVDYGWVLVAVAFLAVSVSFGPVIVFTFGVFLRPLSEEFGWSRGEISTAFSLAALTVSFASPMIGRLTDRLGPRPVVLFCASVYSLAFGSLAWLSAALWHLYATYFVIGLVGNGATQLPYSRAITEWFDRRRGVALSLMMTGVGAGIVIMPALAQALIDGYGWRHAYLTLGVVMFAASVPLPSLLLRRKGNVRAASAGAGEVAGLTVKEAFRTPAFRRLLICFALLSVSLNGCVAHLAPLLTDHGLTAQQAAIAASILGGFTMAGRLMTGWLLDRFFAPRVAAAFFLLAALGVFTLLLPVSQLTAWLAASLIGLSMGAEADAMPYLVSRYFGLRAFTELFGYAFSAYAIAGALGPGLMGFGFDYFGNYQLVVAGLTAAISLGTVLMLSLPRFDQSSLLS